MTCPPCELIKEQDKHIIYEDNLAVVMLAPDPAVKGHLVVLPRQHFQVMSQVPDDVISYLFLIANKVSTLIFETLGCQGTNITVNNRVAAGQEWAHFMINVIPRKENDNIDFNFKRSKADQNELEEIMKRIKEETNYIGLEDKSQQKPEVIEEQGTQEIDVNKSEDDYKLKQLRHIP